MVLKRALVSEEVRRDVVVLVHLYQESIRIAAQKTLSEEDRIELQQLLDSQEETVLQTVPRLCSKLIYTGCLRRIQPRKWKTKRKPSCCLVFPFPRLDPV